MRCRRLFCSSVILMIGIMLWTFWLQTPKENRASFDTSQIHYRTYLVGHVNPETPPRIFIENSETLRNTVHNLMNTGDKYKYSPSKKAINVVTTGTTDNVPIECDDDNGTCSFLVKGKGCSIPYYKPFHKVARHFMKSSNIICKKKSYILVNGTTLRFNKASLSSDHDLSPNQIYCNLFAVKRPDNIDSYLMYALLVKNYKGDYQIHDEFLEVKCLVKYKMVYNDFFLFVPIKPLVEKKCDDAEKKMQSQERASAFHRKEKLNVVMLGFDSMSHLNFIRRLPLSYKYLKNDMSAIELQGYTKLADNTFPCILPLLTGKLVSEVSKPSGPYDKLPFVWKRFSEQGYRTLFAEDAPYISVFNMEKSGFEQPPTDYYLRPLYLEVEPSKMRKGAENEHCFNSRLEVSVIFEWIKDFIQLFRDKPYFAFCFLTRLFHGLFNEPQNADPYLYKLLSQASEQGLMNNTVVMVFGDHGLRGKDFQATRAGKYEERLPLFMIAFPKWFSEKYPKLYKNLKINQHRLTTLFDVHELMKDILNFTGTVQKPSSFSRGISLFQEISLERTCEDAALSPQWCMCNKYVNVSVTGNDVKLCALSLVEKINEITEEERNHCAFLKLHKILSAQEFDTHSNYSSVRVTFETFPALGRFEGTVQFNTGTNETLPAADFSRINKYGHQSDCIHDSFLRIFCYCGGS